MTANVGAAFGGTNAELQATALLPSRLRTASQQDVGRELPPIICNLALKLSPKVTTTRHYERIMEELIKQAIATLIGTTIVSSGLLAVFPYVAKKIFEQSLNHLSTVQIKHIEQTLKIQAETHLKELENVEKRKFLKFSKLHEEQAEIIKSTYSKLSLAYRNVGQLVFHYNFKEKNPELFEHEKQPVDNDPLKWKLFNQSILQTSREENLAEDTTELLRGFLDEFNVNRIFFSAHIASEIQRFSELLLFISSEFRNVSYRDPKTFEVVVAKKMVDTWKLSVESVNGIFPGLEECFREYLGINENKP